ncbi:MAG: putative Flagellin, Flp1-like, domain [Bacillales bacterium]|jgi:Flp pilus assembly pilin Flp|nr:putative Flagellin, Flp1-like, domain [Bacillales bacterium]
MKNYFLRKHLIRRQLISDFIKDEKGETNIVAIILIIVIVIGLVVIFKDRIGSLIDNLFDKIDSKTETL